MENNFKYKVNETLNRKHRESKINHYVILFVILLYLTKKQLMKKYLKYTKKR